MFEKLLKLIQQRQNNQESAINNNSSIDYLLSVLKATVLNEKLSSKLTENQVNNVESELLQISDLLKLDKTEIEKEASIYGSPINILLNEVFTGFVKEKQNPYAGVLGGLMGGLFGKNGNSKSFGPALGDADDIKKPKLR
jgi:hypothetical protein